MFKASGTVFSRPTCFAAVVWLVLSLPSLVGQETGAGNAALPFAWPSSAAAIPAANRTAPSAVATFVREALNGDATLLVPQFIFSTFEQGRIDLVAHVDRRGFHAIVVIRPEGKMFRHWLFTDDQAENLARDAADLDGDGVAELVTAPWAVGYEGAMTDPIYWYVIYKFRDGQPRNVSASFPSLYRGLMLPWLDYLERIFMGLDETDRAAYLYQLEKIQYLRLKYRRQIVGEKLAGLTEALKWADSEKPNVQLLAVRTLQEIDDASSVAELQKLVKSKNQGTCYGAVGALGIIQHREITAADMAPCWQK